MVDRYDEELFLGYVEGTLSHEQATAFEKQMLDDARLRNLVAHMVLDRHRLRGMPDEAPPTELMQRVNERLERQMLLGAPTGEPAPGTSTNPGALVLRYLVYTALAAMILVCVGVFVYTLMPSKLLDDAPMAQQQGPTLALGEASGAGETAALRRSGRDEVGNELADAATAPATPADTLAKGKDDVAAVEPLAVARERGNVEQERKRQTQESDALAQAPAPATAPAPAATSSPAPEAVAKSQPVQPPAATAESAQASDFRESLALKSESSAVGGSVAGATRAPAAGQAAPSPEPVTPKPSAVASAPAATAAPVAPAAPAGPPAEGDARAKLRRDVLGESTALTLTVMSADPQATRAKLHEWATRREQTTVVSAPASSTATPPETPTPPASTETPAAAPAPAPLQVTLPASALVDLLRAAQESGESIRVQVDSPRTEDAVAPGSAGTWIDSAQSLRQDVPMTPVLPLYDGSTRLQVTIVVKTWSPGESAAPAATPLEP